MFVSTSRRARGAAAPVVIGVIVILALLAVAAWYLIFRPHQQAVLGQQPATLAQIAAKAAPPANVAAMSTDQLLAEARKAMNDQRMLAPAGNNAFEFYLKVLERQPNNQVAQDALRETFPFGANAAEQAINQRDFANAQREIDLLAKADPDNYTLTILRSKLDAQQKLMGREQQLAEQQAAKQKVDDAAKQAAQAAQQKAAAQATATQTAATTPPPVQEAKPEPQKPVEVAPPPVQIQDAVPVSQPSARYPSVAKRRRQEGWVDVEFTVGADGSVSDAHVVDANPKHVFDRAATDAVDRWQYKPALRDGKPMVVTMRRRIIFTLGGAL